MCVTPVHMGAFQTVSALTRVMCTDKGSVSLSDSGNLYLDCAKFELTNHIAYRVENKSLISTPRKLISTAGKLIFQVREYT